MSEDHVAALKRVYGRWSEGDFRVDRDLIHSDIVFVLRPEFPDAGTYRGIDSLADYTRGFLEPWTRIAIEAEEFTAAGDRVAVAIRQHGVGSGSGAETEFRYFQVWSFRDGWVVRLEGVRTRAEALEAIGLTE